MSGPYPTSEDPPNQFQHLQTVVNSNIHVSYTGNHSIISPNDVPYPPHFVSPLSQQSLSFTPGYGFFTQQHILPSRYATVDLDLCQDEEIEIQRSINESSMESEAIFPACGGLPSVEKFDELVKSYVDDLSVKKQDKALINSRRAGNIRSVLEDPKSTSIESAQFRFWVKKMFSLEEKQHWRGAYICHEGKPVAIREKLFKILTKAHQRCRHGGRDKTSAEVRKIYSWVPKELISRFVKICPTCQDRRGNSCFGPFDFQLSSLGATSSPVISAPISTDNPIVGHVNGNNAFFSPRWNIPSVQALSSVPRNVAHFCSTSCSCHTDAEIGRISMASGHCDEMNRKRLLTNNDECHFGSSISGT